MAADHCPNCGQENQIEDQFCIKCGTPLHKEVKTSLPAENTNNLVIPVGCAWCAERPGTQVIETIVQVQEANVKRTVHMHLERCDECERFSKKIRPIEIIVGLCNAAQELGDWNFQLSLCTLHSSRSHALETQLSSPIDCKCDSGAGVGQRPAIRVSI